MKTKKEESKRNIRSARIERPSFFLPRHKFEGGGIAHKREHCHEAKDGSP